MTPVRIATSPTLAPAGVCRRVLYASLRPEYAHLCVWPFSL
jgi:hypothetical protein